MTTSNSRDHWNKFYTENKSEQIPWSGGRKKLLKLIIEDLGLSKESSVLEVGCGSGDNLFFLSSLGFVNVDGLDISEVAIDLARSQAEQLNLKSTFVAKDPTQLGIDLDLNQKYDLILDLVTSQFFDADGKQNYLKNISSLLKSDGHFILYTYSKDGDSDSLDGVPEWIRGVAQSEDYIKSIYGQYFKIYRKRHEQDLRGDKLDLYYMTPRSK